MNGNQLLVVSNKQSAIFLWLLLLTVTLLSGCDDDVIVSSPGDTTPVAFSFIDQTGVALNTLTESAAITVGGITADSEISVIGGEYSIDGAAYTSAPDTVINGQLVTVRHTSSSANNTAVDTTLTIGGVSDIFTTITIVAAGLYSVVDTNQTVCYSSSTGAVVTCAGTGQDGAYSGNQPVYVVSGDGLTVLDNVTGLRWTQSTDINNSGAVDYNDKLYQSAAVTYCANLGTGGYTWRLPDIKEAYSLIMFSGKDPSSYIGSDTSLLTPFTDPVFDRAFGDKVTAEGIAAGDRIIDGQYATTSMYVSTTMNGDNTMFGVNFVDGRIKGYPSDRKEFYVRCVTGNTSYGMNLFADNGDSTVSDAATGLMWQKDDSASTDWDDAVATCEGATTSIYSDWRLPNVKELQSIVDYTRSPDTDSSAAIDPIFNSTSFMNEEGVTDWGYYWASTTHQNINNNSTHATYVSFGRALGYLNTMVGWEVLDVHGAGAQRSNGKLNIAAGADGSADIDYGSFYYHGPQGDILRLNNKVRCVRN